MSHHLPAIEERACRAGTTTPAVLTALLTVGLTFVVPDMARANLEASEHPSTDVRDGATVDQSADVRLISENGPMSTFGVRLLPSEFAVPIEGNQSYPVLQSLAPTQSPPLSLAPSQPVAPVSTPTRRAKSKSRARGVFVLGDDPERGVRVAAPPSSLDPVGAPIQLTDEYLARILWFAF